MNVRLLIDAIVKQTTVLIAQIATSGGLRAPLAHVAGQVFIDLTRELENQGVPARVRADMFGMALRTYQRHTQRLAQSRTDRGRTLWEAVFGYLEKNSVVTREELFGRFRHDDEASLRGVLRDLTDSGLLFASGSGQSSAYRIATPDEVGKMQRSGDASGVEAFVWSAVYREPGATAERLSAATGLDKAAVEAALAALAEAGRVESTEAPDGATYRSRELVLGLEDPTGWEASVLDHYSALVKTIAQKLSVDQKASLSDEVGGSTYHFTLFRGHPLEAEVLGELRRFRERMTALRARVDRATADHPAQAERIRVDAYYGQCVLEEDDASQDI
jgi:DNA-binding MarR family transcriptional regulator